jgi:hypothetical protein
MASAAACAQEPPPALQPAGRQPPVGQQPVPAVPATAPSAAARPAATQPSAPTDRPATQPAAAVAAAVLLPPEQVLAQMPRLFADLSAAEPAVREAARSALMGMSRQDLPAFEKLVRDNVPLAPAQAAVLREIVTHVFLAGEEYPPAPAARGSSACRWSPSPSCPGPPATGVTSRRPPPSD